MLFLFSLQFEVRELSPALCPFLNSSLATNCEKFMKRSDSFYQQLIALQITNCYRTMGGFSEINCSFLKSNIEPDVYQLQNCIRGLTDGALLNLFVSQLDRTYDLCVYMRLESMQQRQSNLTMNMINSGEALIKTVDEIDQKQERQMRYLKQTQIIIQELAQTQKEDTAQSTTLLKALQKNLLLLLNMSEESVEKYENILANVTGKQMSQLQYLDQVVVILELINIGLQNSSQVIQRLTKQQQVLGIEQDIQLNKSSQLANTISNIGVTTDHINEMQSIQVKSQEQLNHQVEQLNRELGKSLNTIEAGTTRIKSNLEFVSRFSGVFKNIKFKLHLFGLEQYALSYITCFGATKLGLINSELYASVKNTLMLGMLSEVAAEKVLRNGIWGIQLVYSNIVASVVRMNYAGQGLTDLIVKNNLCQYDIQKTGIKQCSKMSLVEFQLKYRVNPGFVVGLVQVVIRGAFVFYFLKKNKLINMK
ncbi:Conserved_hypothetical protein [Hexamita inflata]|uniref:Uncharacterized protein n=1 Tax=Hexamita inflata TaxID=28002 RepID=A0ABP1HF39_9EUKA